jgi:hypothetical protein
MEISMAKQYQKPLRRHEKRAGSSRKANPYLPCFCLLGKLLLRRVESATARCFAAEEKVTRHPQQGAVEQLLVDQRKRTLNELLT